ncbi:MAG: amino acid adenylation domain-containing protein [Saccharofermentans sp.]|nr:amino acid adenylation domain-containing protein [Saccharofermentans sp.]
MEIKETLVARLRSFAGGNEAARNVLVVADGKNGEALITYRELYDLICRMRTFLRRNTSVSNGSSVLIVTDDDMLSTVVSFFAVVAEGGTAVPVQPDKVMDANNRCRIIAEDAETDFVIAGSSYDDLRKIFKDREVIRSNSYMNIEQIEDIDPYDHQEGEMMILYTSGSTGEPRSVVYTNEMVSSLAELYSSKFCRDKDSVAIVNLPLCHAFGNGCTFFPELWGGGLSVLTPSDMFVKDPGRWFALVTKYRVTHMATLNYTVSLLSEYIENSRDELTGSDLSSLKALTIGGEYLREETVDRFTALAKPYGFDPRSFSICYGMTELMILANTPYLGGLKKASAVNHDDEFDASDIYCAGEVIGDRKVYCLDDNEMPVEAGMIGEICVTADPVMKRFSGLRSVRVGNDICYKTGDVGFILDGDAQAQEIYICGRSKDIINIKGEVYSPFMIEDIVEKSDPHIIRSVAMSVPGKNTEELVIVAECEETDLPELADKMNRSVMRRLPIKVGRVIFVDEEMPRTSMGKIIRKEIRRLYAKGELKGTTYTPSICRPGEDILSFIKEHSGIDEIDENTPIASLCLNSLEYQILASRTGLKISEIFSSNTLGDILERTKETDDNVKTAVPCDMIPLTEIGRAYIAGRDPEMDWGGVPCQYYTERDIKALDVTRFTDAVKSLTVRHPILRGVVHDNEYLKIIDDIEPPITIARGADDIKIRERMTSTALPLDAPLFEIVLNEIDGGVWRIHLRIDMICCDAMSMMIFWNDLLDIYEGRVLPDAVFSFAEDPAPSDEDIRYWEKKAEDFPSMPLLPYNNACEKTLRGKVRRCQFLIDKDRYDAFEKMVAGMGLTPSAAFMTLFTELLSGYGSGSRMALNVTVMGRRDNFRPGQYSIGEYTEILLFASGRDNVSVLENALRIQENLRADLDHMSLKGSSFARMLREYNDEDVFYPIVFTSLLGLDAMTGSRSIFSIDDHSASSTPQVLLDHQLLPSEKGIIVNWDIVEEAFEDGIAEAMFETYRKLVFDAMEESFWHHTITDIRRDKDKDVQNAANRTEKSIPDRLLTQGFAHLAKGNTDTAVIHQGIRYSYSMLEHRSAQYGQMLAENGIVPGDRVMIQMYKSFELTAAIIGIVRIGAVYVPMPYDQPLSRQEEIYLKCKAKVILADKETDTHNAIPRMEPSDADGYEGDITDADISPDELAYIIFTSGSTGTPKGVAITHKGAMNTIQAVNEYIGLDRDDTLIGLSSVSFDLSVYDIFGAISKGASLVVPTEAERIDPSSWLEICIRDNVTVWNTVPALMDIFLEYLKTARYEKLKIRDVILSGDWIPMDLFGKLQNSIPGARLTSMGGATEASIWSNYLTVEKIEDGWKSIPYGYPLPNQLFHVLDDFDRPVPCGVSGKLYIGGKGLAQCYYNEKELTDNAFRMIRGERLYDTGDHGRYDNKGCITFLGRKDSQVKINGYRIELGEIQSALEKLGYKENLVVTADGKGKTKELYAFVRTEEDFSESDCKEQLEGLLPHYFVPKRITAVGSFPVTPNGKIDRKELLTAVADERKPVMQTDDRLDELELKILSIIKTELKLEGLSPEDRLSDLGLTSLDLIKLANRLECEFGRRARINEIIRYRKIREFFGFYKKEQQEEMISTSSQKTDDPYADHPVMEILRDELELPGLSSDDRLRDAGLSSIAVIRTANRLDLLYGFRPTVQDLSTYDTGRDLIEFYKDAKPQEQDADEYSDITELLNRCREHEITIWAEEGKLRFKAPKGALTPELKAGLSDAKAKLLDYLSRNDSIVISELTPLQTAYVVGRQNSYALGDITADYYVEYSASDLDIHELERALNEVISKNEILRTVFYPNGTAEVPDNLPEYRIEVIDEECDRDVRSEMLSHSFELGKWPMLDVKVKLHDDHSVVHVDIDCLILDGWSIRSFLAQLMASYSGNPIETTSYTFRQYLADEQKWLREKRYYAEARRYWEEQINMLPPAPHLPLKTPIENIRKPVFSRKSFVLDDDLTSAFWEKLHKYDLTPSLALCTAYMMSLSKWSSNRDVTLDLTMFNRQPVHPDVQKVLGDFTNIALIGYEDKKCSFLEHTRDVGRQLWNAIEYRSCNVINMLGILAKKYNDVIAAPYVFTSLIDVDNDMGHNMLADAGFREMFAQTRTPQVLLDHQLYYSGGKLVLGIDYVEQAFDEDMLESMFRDYTERVRLLAVTDDWEAI